MTDHSGGAAMHGGHEEEPEVVNDAPNRPEVDEPNEVTQEIDEDHALAMAIENQQVPADPKEQKALRKKLMKRLSKASGSEGRVETMSKLADWVGLEVLVGTIFPGVGDAGTAIVETTYLLGEASRANMAYSGRAKIVGAQLLDAAIGATPIVGDVADYMFMANRISAAEFRKTTEKLASEALEAGVPTEEIEKILASGARLRKALAITGKVVGATKKKDASNNNDGFKAAEDEMAA